MRLIAVAALAAILAGPAVAQSTWQEYSYPDQEFAVSFPAEPSVERMPFSADDGTMAVETIYSVRQDSGSFRVAVIEFDKTGLDDTTAINQAIDRLREKGDVKFDIPARVQRNYGRYLNIAGSDGSHTIAAVFFGANRLYQLEGTVTASNPDALSGEMIRFQQSLRFMGEAAGGGGGGFGRGQFQGGGCRFGRGNEGQQPTITNP